MKALAAILMLSGLVVPALAQTNDFPLMAKVVSSGKEIVPGTGGVTTAATSPQILAQFPNVAPTHAVRISPRSYVSTRAEIGVEIYTLRGGKLINPGSYPASVDGRTVRLLTKDGHGKPKIQKLHVLSVEARP